LRAVPLRFEAGAALVVGGLLGVAGAVGLWFGRRFLRLRAGL